MPEQTIQTYQTRSSAGDRLQTDGPRIDLTLPHLRAWMEVEMKTVDPGQQSKQEVTHKIVEWLMVM